MTLAHLDQRQVKGLSTNFHYDLQDDNGAQIPYSTAMGDIFYHLVNDVLINHKYRQVPKDFADPKTAAGAIHAYFRDFMIIDQTVRNEVIRIFLNSASHEREDMQGYLQYIDTAIRENDSVANAQDLMAKCLIIEERAYQRSLGFQVSVPDPKAQEKLQQFFISASLRQVYQLKNYIVDACINDPEAPLNVIINSANQARLTDNEVKPRD